VVTGLVAVRVPADQAGDIFHVLEQLRIDPGVEHLVEPGQQLPGTAVCLRQAGDVLGTYHEYCQALPSV